MEYNKTCKNCDYREACRKRIRFNGVMVEAKHQNFVELKCMCKVMDICRNCKLFKAKKCANWKVLNGKLHQLGDVVVCPKKDKLGR